MSTTKVRLRVSVEVVMPSSWGDDCSLAQVKRQAMQEARGRISNALGNTYGVRVLEVTAFEIVAALDVKP